MSADEKRAIAAMFLFLVIVILLLVMGEPTAALTLELLSYLP